MPPKRQKIAQTSKATRSAKQTPKPSRSDSDIVPGVSAEHADEQDTADATNDASHDIDDKKNDDVDDSNNGSDAQTDEAGDGTPIDMSSLFEIELAAPTSKTGTKKRRRGLPMSLQENTFDSSLNVMYAVKFNYGNGRWDAINKYTKFILGEKPDQETFKIGDVVYVKAEEGVSWVAEVLEIRALDAENVFVRVSWLYRPEDLPDGRQDYHGEGEVLPSNDMQVIDAMTVEGKVGMVRHYNEAKDDDLKNGYDELFWRQTYDARSKRFQPPLRKYCICKKFANPNQALIKCDQSTCGNFWMHQQCIIDAAVTKAYLDSTSNHDDTAQNGIKEKAEEQEDTKAENQDDDEEGSIIVSRPGGSGIGSMLQKGINTVGSILARSVSPSKDARTTPAPDTKPPDDSGKLLSIKKSKQKLDPSPSSTAAPSTPSKTIESVVSAVNGVAQQAIAGIQDAVTGTAKKRSGRPKKTRDPADLASDETRAIAYKSFSATIGGLPDDGDEPARGGLQVEIEDLREGDTHGRKWTESVRCLKCGHAVD